METLRYVKISIEADTNKRTIKRDLKAYTFDEARSVLCELLEEIEEGIA